MSDMTKGRYKELLDQQHTMTLDEYKACVEFDSNAFWRIEDGHHQNLLDDALEVIDELRAEVQRITAERDQDPAPIEPSE